MPAVKDPFSTDNQLDTVALAERFNIEAGKLNEELEKMLVKVTGDSTNSGDLVLYQSYLSAYEQYRGTQTASIKVTADVAKGITRNLG